MEEIADSINLFVDGNDTIVLVACCLVAFLFVFWEEIKKSFKKKDEEKS